MSSFYSAIFVIYFFIANLFPLFGQEIYTRFKVGVNAPLSGDLAEFGVAVKNGIEMACSDQKKACQNLDFLYEDNKYEAKTAITAFNKLLDIDNVDLEFVWGDQLATAIVPVAERRKVPTLAVLTDPRSTKATKYTIRFLNTFDQYGQALITYLKARNVKKIGMVYVDDPYFNNLVLGLRMHLNKGQTLDIISNHQLSDGDFKTSILKLKKGSFDVIGVYLLPGQVSTFFRQAQTLGLKTLFFGADVFESRSEIENAGGAMNGAIYSHNIVKYNFKNLYVKRYGNDFQIAYAANAYEFAKLIIHLFGGLSEKLSAETILEKIAQTESTDGAAGKYTVEKSSESGSYSRFPIAVKQIEGTNIKVIAP